MTAPSVIGKYELIRKLATGGMAEVYLARVAGPMGFEKTVVLKRILPHLAEDPGFVDMFLSEARLAAQLNHPNVVQIFDFGQEQDIYLLVMEYIDGPNLRALVRRAAEQGQPIDFALAAKIISFACEGLSFAHDFVDPATGEPMGLVHRDVSPDNILLARNGGVKVVDFGIAKAANQSHHTKTGTIKGKFAYMPPEQLKGLALDRRADVFALGIVLYELVTGVKPFDTNTDAQILQAILYEPMRPAAQARPETPEALQRIIDRALEKNRDLRYADCRELQGDLERFIVSLGQPVGQYQLAQLVQRLAGPAQAIPPAATPAPRPSQAGLLAHATPHPSSAALGAVPPLPTEATTPMGLRAAELPGPGPASPAPPPTPASQRVEKRSGGFPSWAAVLSVGVLLLAAAGYLTLRGAPGPVADSQAGAALDAGAAAAVAPEVPAEVPAAVDAGAAEPEVDAGAAVVPAPPVGKLLKPPRPIKPARPPPRQPPALAQPGPEQPAPAAPRTVETGTVEFRVRPYATVYVNGRPYGDTPFAEIVLPVGTVQVRLVNRDLGRDVTVPFEVKAGKNTFKQNLGE